MYAQDSDYTPGQSLVGFTVAADHTYLSAVGDYYVSLRRPTAPGPDGGR